VLDAGAGSPRHPQPVQGKQRDQRVLTRRPEPGGCQQRARLAAVQGDGVRLVVHSRTADVGSRSSSSTAYRQNPAMVHGRRVTVARARPLASRSRAKPSMPARRTANRLRERAPAPAGELAQVQGVRLSCQAAVPGQGKPFLIAECWLKGDEGGCGSGHRYLPVLTETDEAGPVGLSND
jgi:hypothetical protein